MKISFDLNPTPYSLIKIVFVGEEKRLEIHSPLYEIQKKWE